MNQLQLQNVNITIRRLPFSDCSNLFMNERDIKKNRNKSDCNQQQAKELKVVLEKTVYSKLTKKDFSCVDENKPIPSKMPSTKTDTKSDTRFVLNKSKRASNKTSPINLTKVDSKNKNRKVDNDVQECTLPAQRLRKNNCTEEDSNNKNINQKNITFRKNRHKSDSNPQQVKELKVVLERTFHSELTRKDDSRVEENKQMDTKSTKCVSDTRFVLNKSKNASNNRSQINFTKVDPKNKNKKVDNVLQERTLSAERLKRNNCTKENLKTKTKNVDNAVRECTLPEERLRKNNFVDYCELSINEFKPPSLDKNHIPVYKQNIPDEISPHPTSEDPYALDVSDSSQPITKKKKRKVRRNVLIKLGNKKINKQKPINKKHKIDYNTMVNSIVKEVMIKVNNKKIVNNNTQHLEESINVSLKEADVIPVDFVSEVNGTKKCDDLINGDNNRVENSGDGNRVENSEELPSHTHGNDQNRFDNSSVITHIQFLNESQKNPQLSNIVESHNHTAISSQSPVVSKSSRVNILSNINVTSTPFHCMNQEIHNSFLSKSLQNNEHFDDNHQDSYEEDSESENDGYFGFTLESERPRKRIAKPWRFMVEYKRNRHILLINKNGLPCKCQDLVIDYELVKRMGWNTNTKPIQSKPLEQRTMLNYIQTSQNHQIVHVSLYNYEEFNISPRKPLREIHNNNQMMSTPKRNINFNVGSPNVSIIAHEENIENVNITHHETPRKDYTRQSIFHKTRENENQEIEDVDPKEDDYDVGLFDDIEVNENVDFNIELPKLKFPKGKRIRKNSEDCEHDDHHEKKSKKKKKNDMTKAEMAEFEAWASKINARFAEDDKHELTIM